MVQITRLNESHIDELHVLEQAAFSEPWSKVAFLKELENPNGYYIIAQKDGKIVGYAGMWVILDEGHITNIAVEKQYRGEGIGKELVRELIKKAKSLKLMGLTLEVRESNIGAQKLYESLGFYNVGIRNDYYHYPAEDALIMWNYFDDDDKNEDY